jgi:pyruvate,water dikinase
VAVNRRYVLSSSEGLTAGRAEIGGKSFGLSKLTQLGADVPPFFTVASNAFFSHLDRAGLWQKASSGLASLSGRDPTIGSELQLIEKVCDGLCRAIREAHVPQEIRDEVEGALAEIAPGPFAVRSSMHGEDSADHSFAGQLESFLFCRNADEVLESLRAAWASAMASRVVAYRLRIGDELGLPSMGVVVQRMISGCASGVVFTADPSTGRRERSLITAAWGLGEGVVSGACDTDEYWFDHASQRELDSRLATKSRQVVHRPDGAPGTVEMPVEEPLQLARCLSPQEVATLGQKTLALSRALGGPQDMEWTKDHKGRFFLLQARPVTALPIVENADGPRIVFDNSNIQESYCGVTTPLTFSFASRAYASVYRQTMRAVGIDQGRIDEFEPVLENLLGLVHGRVYYNINNWYRGLLVLPSFGRNKADMERMMGLAEPVDFVEDERLSLGEKLRRLPGLLRTLIQMLRSFRALPRLVPAFLGRFARECRALDRAQIAGSSFSQLMEMLERLDTRLLNNWHVPIFNDFWVMMSVGRLRRLVESTGVSNAAILVAALMSGEDGIESTEPTRFLMRLAARFRGDPALLHILRTAEPSSILLRLAEARPDIAAMVEDYIERYGDRVMGELKLETVTLRQDSAFLFQVLRNYVERADLDPVAIVQREKESRAAAQVRLRELVPWQRRLSLEKVLFAARTSVKFRENMRLARTVLFGLYREVYRALGRRLVEVGRLESLEDVFYLTVQEIEAYHQGRAACADLGALAKVRRAEFASYERRELPNQFETVGPVYHGNRFSGSARESIDPNLRVLTGIGCYPGVVERCARVILSPKDELNLKGQILVTLRTDPGWAPLFPSVSGIAVERGSSLSHSAVVARELGIPAVVGVPGLLSVVKDGVLLRLDGAQGTVRLLDSPTKGAP